MRTECNNQCKISGHLYQLTRAICVPNRVSYKDKLAKLKIGRIDTDHWWVSVLADRGINGYAHDFPNHFKRVCNHNQ